MSTSLGERVRVVVKVAALNLLITSLAATALVGQLSPELKLHVWAGAIDAQGELQDAPILASSPNVLSYGALPARPSLGIGFEVSAWQLPVALRLGVARSLADQRTGEWSCAPRSAEQPCPAILIEVPTDMTTTIGSADFVGSIPLARASIHPLAGVSWVRHDYSWDARGEGAFSLETGEFARNAAAFHVGLGLSAPIGKARVLAEYSQHLSKQDLARPSRLGTASVGLLIPIL